MDSTGDIGDMYGPYGHVRVQLCGKAVIAGEG